MTWKNSLYCSDCVKPNDRKSTHLTTAKGYQYAKILCFLLINKIYLYSWCVWLPFSFFPPKFTKEVPLMTTSEKFRYYLEPSYRFKSPIFRLQILNFLLLFQVFSVALNMRLKGWFHEIILQREFGQNASGASCNGEKWFIFSLFPSQARYPFIIFPI